MEKSFSESYKKAGVDVTAGYKAVKLMKKSVRETYTKRSCIRSWRIWRIIFYRYQTNGGTNFSIRN